MREAKQDSIGWATMKEDGTLILDLRAEAKGGVVGHARFVYGPDHPQYAAMIAHVGPIRPGLDLPVPPWPA